MMSFVLRSCILIGVFGGVELEKGKVGGWEGDSSEEAGKRIEPREEGVRERGEASVARAAPERGQPAGVLRMRLAEASCV